MKMGRKMKLLILPHKRVHKKMLEMTTKVMKNFKKTRKRWK